MSLKPPIEPTDTFASLNGVARVGAFGRTGGAQTGLTVIVSPLDRMPKGLRDDGTDMSSVIQAEIDAIAADTRVSGKVRLPEGEFAITAAGLTAHTTSLTLESPGGQATLIQNLNQPIFSPGVSPRALSSIPLTVDVAIGATTLTMSTANSATLAAGMYLDLRSSILFGANAPLNEVVRIQSVNTGTGVITLYGPTEEAYTVANSAKVYVMSFTGEVALLNVGFRNSTPDERPSATNETQTIEITGGAVSGTYTITYPANSLGIGTSASTGIALDADEEAIEVALDPLLGVDNYRIDGTGASFEITYVGEDTLGFRNIPTPTVNVSGLSGGTPAATVTTVATGGPSPENVNAVLAKGLKNLHVERCSFIGIDQVGVDITDCLRSEVCYSHWEDLSDDLTFARSGYGVRAVGSSRDGKIHHNTSRKGRHFFTTSGAIRHFDITDNRATEHTNVPFDSHAGARHIRYARNVTEGCNGGSYQARSADVTIEDFKIIGNGSTGPQIYTWAKDSGVTYPDYTHGTMIRRGKIEGCAGNLIKANNADDVLIEDLRVRRHRLGASSMIFFGTTTANRGKVRNVHAECTVGDTGWIVEFNSGAGHSYDDVYGKNVAIVVRPRSGLTDFRAGRVSGDNATNLIGTEWPSAGALELPRMAGSGSPEGVVRAPTGSQYTDGVGGGVYIKSSGGHSTTGWAGLGAPDIDVIEASSQVSTISSRRNLASQTVTVGEALGTAAVCKLAGTYTKMRFCVGATFTSITDLRLAVHDISGVKLGETDNLIGLGGITTPAANAYITDIPLLVGVALATGDEVMLTIAAVGTTMTALGQTFGNASIGSAGAHRRTRRVSWAGGVVIPNLGTSTASAFPWIELIP